MARKAFILLGLVVLLLAGWVIWRLADSRSAPPPATRGGSLVASLRSEPTRYNRYVEATAAGELVSLLTDARLVRVNRASDVVEPALAESWTQSPDGRTYTFTLRQGVRFSDGSPFTADDVMFTSRVMYDPDVNSAVGAAMRVNGEPLTFTADGPFTVRVVLPAPFAPGLRLLDNMPILPRHKLEAAFDDGTLRDAWRVGTAPDQLAGLGPFVLTEHVSGQRLVFQRNPHYWRQDAQGVQLPYLDTLTIAIIADQNTEALRLDSGETDLMANADIRPDDYAAFKRSADAGRLRLMPVGVGLDPNLLWFNLSKSLRPEAAWIREPAFRAAVSHAVNRQAMADTVYLGEAMPIYGPISPGNKTWHSSTAPQQPFDQARSRALLASLGLADRNGDGLLDDRSGRPVRFSIVTQKGHTIRERSASMIQEHLKQVGIAVDVVALDQGAVAQQWMQGQYDSIFFGIQASATDPALNPEFWLSSGPFHFWNPGQASPETAWEAEIDDLMRRQSAAQDLGERQRLFAEVQRIFGEQLPAIYFVAPRVTVAVSRRVGNATPVPQIPQLLWTAETLTATGR